MAMPRWVLSELVDSAAMRQAFFVWRENSPELAQQWGFVDGLPVIVHCPEIPTPDDKLIEIPCPRGNSCKRCSEGRSGYTFRWFSRLWLVTYMHWRRDGTWAPGDPEGYRVTPRVLGGFSGELLDSRGNLIVDEVMEEPQPTFAFRYDSVLSHLSIMRPAKGKFSVEAGTNSPSR